MAKRINLGKEKIRRLKRRFDQCVHYQEGVEFCFARDLQKLLDYSQWEGFLKIIKKAMAECQNQRRDVESHFARADRQVLVAKGKKLKSEDFMLARYACYLIAQQGDFKKELVAFAIIYFAYPGREEGLVEKRIAEWRNLKEHEKERLFKKDYASLFYEEASEDKSWKQIHREGQESLLSWWTT